MKKNLKQAYDNLATAVHEYLIALLYNQNDLHSKEVHTAYCKMVAAHDELVDAGWLAL